MEQPLNTHARTIESPIERFLPHFHSVGFLVHFSRMRHGFLTHLLRDGNSGMFEI